MEHNITTPPIEGKRLAHLREMEKMAFHAEPRFAELKAKLLAAGGDMALFARADVKVLDDLLDQSVFIPPGQFEICQMQVSQCHKNASWLYRRGKGRIMTGYCLGKDGLWRSHSWLKSEAGHIETTLVGLLYCGYELSEEECKAFASEELSNLMQLAT